MADLTPGQCARLSLLAGYADLPHKRIEWRVMIANERHELQFRTGGGWFMTMWHTMMWSKTEKRLNERIKAADTYYKAAVSIQDVLKVGPHDS